MESGSLNKDNTKSTIRAFGRGKRSVDSQYMGSQSLLKMNQSKRNVQMSSTFSLYGL